MKNAVIVFGYNNTRIYDIERIKNYCSNHLNSEIVLCKENITDQDTAITPFTFKADLDKRENSNINAQIIEMDQYLAKNNLNPIACLPFSDKGITLGSYFAKSRGLTHDDCERSLACIDKYTFRCLEAKEITPTWYKKPFFQRVYSIEEAALLVEKTTIPLFFKPTSEGNSRGCIQINSIEDFKNNLNILAPYFAQGILVEECIQDCDEFSFDGVDGCYVITEKKTSSGFYRVETQHIVPAPLKADHYQRLIDAGKIVASISGSKLGAVHNELFLNKNTGEVYCVEPNRRPAGLKLWDWIQEAYTGIDNWNSWLSWASGKKRDQTLPNKNDYFVGCKMLQAPHSGTIRTINHQARIKLEESPEIIEIVFTKDINSKVNSILKDNSDFIGYVVCKHKSIDELRKLLNSIANEATLLFEIY